MALWAMLQSITGRVHPLPIVDNQTPVKILSCHILWNAGRNDFKVTCVNEGTTTIQKIKANKKVLLRERKRHTARRVASTCYAALSNPDLVRGGGGYPIQTWWGEYPIQTWSRGYPGYPPPSRPGMGYP